MSQSIISDRIIRDAAAESQYTINEIEKGVEQLHKTLQDRINHHYKRCKLRNGRDYLVLRGEDSFWFAFLLPELYDELRQADVDMEDGLLKTIAIAHLEDFQRMGFTVSFPKSIGRQIKDPFFYPVRVRQPEDWTSGRYHAFQTFKEFVHRRDMTPAEALDYWVLEETNLDAIDWAGCRGVDPEAVRKNVRQAKEKMSDPELGATPEVLKMRTESLDDVPEGDPMDDERFYIPAIREEGYEPELNSVQQLEES